MCNSLSTYTEVPASSGVVRRLDREWKVTNAATNFLGGTFSMDFKLNSCAVVGSVTASDLRLMIDDDGDFFSRHKHSVGLRLGQHYHFFIQTGDYCFRNFHFTHCFRSNRVLTIGSANVATLYRLRSSGLMALRPEFAMRCYGRWPQRQCLAIMSSKVLRWRRF